MDDREIEVSCASGGRLCIVFKAAGCESLVGSRAKPKREMFRDASLTEPFRRP